MSKEEIEVGDIILKFSTEKTVYLVTEVVNGNYNVVAVANTSGKLINGKVIRTLFYGGYNIYDYIKEQEKELELLKLAVRHIEENKEDILKNVSKS